jgi:molybdopterin synthase sulfur carrier subunit
MKVRIPTHLRSYTGLAEVEATGSTLAEALGDLERRYPGFRFRIVDEQDDIREHIKIFVNQKQVHSLALETRPDDVIQIVAALSGG